MKVCVIKEMKMVKKEGKMGRMAKSDSGVETRTLLEAMRGDIRTIAEGHAGLSRKLAEHDVKFELILRKLEEHDNGFIAVDRRFDRLEMVVMEMSETFKAAIRRLGDHEGRITRLEDKNYH